MTGKSIWKYISMELAKQRGNFQFHFHQTLRQLVFDKLNASLLLENSANVLEKVLKKHAAAFKFNFFSFLGLRYKCWIWEDV